jgi:hypothetical protein
MINLSEVVASMTYGQRYLCIVSMSKDFLTNKEYPVQFDEEGYLYIEDENLERVYTDEDTVGAYVTFKLVTPGEVFKASKQVLPTFELNKEKTMSPSKIQETIQRLNGQTPAQARLAELRQVSSSKQTVELDLAHLLLTSESVKALKPGKDCLVTGLSVDHHSSKVTLSLSVGEVVKEETEAVRVALEELIKPKA